MPLGRLASDMADPTGHYVVSDLRQIKALADPLRRRILGAFCEVPRTTKQVAVLLDQPPTKLYRHVALLESVGLVRLVRTEPKRGTVEKYFQAVANSFSLAASSLGGDASGSVDELFVKAFDEMLADIRSGIQSGSIGAGKGRKRTVLLTGSARLTPDGVEEFHRRVAELAKELDCGLESGSPYKLLLALCPEP